MRVLANFVVLVSCLSGGYGATPANLPPDPAPVATLDLSSLLPPGQLDLKQTTIAFVSESSITVRLCAKDKRTRWRAAGGALPRCSLSLVSWQKGVLRPTAHLQDFNSWARVNPATDGRVLATCYGFGCSPVLYSADLSTSLRLTTPISVVSPSGSTVATITVGGEEPTPKGLKPTHGGWKIYHLASTPGPITPEPPGRG